MKKVLITVGVLAVLGTVAFIGYKQGWFSNKATDAQIKKLIATSNASGADITAGVSFDVVKKRFGNLTKEEIEDLISLVAKGEKNWSASEKQRAEKLLKK